MHGIDSEIGAGAPNPSSRESFVREGVLHALLQRHAAALRTLNNSANISRMAIIALLLISWILPVVWIAHVLALLAALSWLATSQHNRREIKILERVIAGENITADEPGAHKWEDILVYFRSEMSAYRSQPVEQYVAIGVIVLSAIVRLVSPRG